MKPNPRFWTGKRVCVTGGTGFLGWRLTQQLLALGAEVRVLALPPAAAHPLLGQTKTVNVFGDVRDPAAARAATAGCDAIFHTAGTVEVWGAALAKMYEVHVQGTETVLAAAPPAARVVHTSSIVAVGASRAAEPVAEDAPFTVGALRVDYVRAKRAAEAVALAAAARGRDVVVTNPGYLVGPGDYEPSVMGRFCVRAWKGRIPLAPPGGFNLVDVRDVATGHLLAAEHGLSGRRYILGGENRSLRDFLALLAEVAGLRPRGIPRLPWWALAVLAGAAEARSWLTRKEPYPAFQHVRLNRLHWFCRSDRAAGELGYRARPLSDTLADTYCWFESMGPLSLRGLNCWWMRPGGKRRVERRPRAGVHAGAEGVALTPFGVSPL